ncbi:leishmanolysin-related zinc metalloendopeptidase [Herbidospora yilanensis]|uniref:leishmanolysin-related zinc metalloendopeptidase n=1 Tax=Herbidospora yilanensis TaxID=354426 RepID=UPI0007815467|nr:leishmanolysin-related zinc metalloendopeptidase [Herbidospora yilanensis]
MGEFDFHVARASAQRARAVAETRSPFTIEVRFLGGLSDTQKAAFAAAADRWARVIVGDLPEVEIPGLPRLPDGLTPGEIVDDILILARGAEIDGPGTPQGNILGQARPLLVRSGTRLPAVGEMTFDSFDLDRMEENGLLHDVICHEMGHTLGLGGGIWQELDLVQGLGTTGPVFTGVRAGQEFAALLFSTDPHVVPVENVGGPGSVGSHWRESVFGAELMTSRVASGVGNPMSRLTAAALADMGYQVDMAAGEPYVLPSQLLLADLRAVAPETMLICGVSADQPPVVI